MKVTHGFILLLMLAMAVPATYAQCGSCKSCSSCGGCGSDQFQSCGVEEELLGTDSSVFITTADLQKKLNSKTPPILLDARPQELIKGKRIPGAKALHTDSKVSEILRMMPDKEMLVVAYATDSESNDAIKLAEHLKSLGYKNVVIYSEGIKGWQKAGKVLETIKIP